MVHLLAAMSLALMLEPTPALTDALSRVPSPFLPSDGVLSPPEPFEGDITGFERPSLAPRPVQVPRSLLMLEASFVALQGLDIVSTLRARNAGLGEAHPLMRTLGNNTAALVGVKAGATVATIWLIRGVARDNRLLAITTMAAIDAGYSMLVVHNLQAARRR